MTESQQPDSRGTPTEPAEPTEPTEPAGSATGPVETAAAASDDAQDALGDASGTLDQAGVADTPADPASSEVPVDAQDAPAAEAVEDDLDRAQREVTELTGDLQRLQAEFLNYKRRVERDRELIRENATYAVLAPIVEVLDTIDRAREHGPLDEGFRAVAEQLERVVAQQGLIRFGAPGDAFDPNLHEALSHLGTDAEVAVTTCKQVVKAGYRIGDRVVRAAQVLVVDPETAGASED